MSASPFDLVRAAASRLELGHGAELGLGPALGPANTPFCFDTRAFVGAQPWRAPRVLVVGPLREAEPLLIALRKMGFDVGHITETAALQTDYRTASVLVVPPFVPVGDALAVTLWGLASGCAVVAAGDIVAAAGGANGNDLARYVYAVPSSGAEFWDTSPAQLDPEVACGVAALCLRTGETPRGQSARENGRRFVTGAHSDLAYAIRFSDVGQRVAARLAALASCVPAVADAYMWPGERALLAVAAATLHCEGAVLEVGIGSCGTLLSLAAGTVLGVADAVTGIPRVAAYHEVVGIDNFSYQPEAQREAAEAAQRDWPGLSVIKSPSVAVSWTKPLAFLHVDAGHDYADCAGDLAHFAPHLVPGGVLAVDDYGTVTDQPGVRKATDEFIAREPAKWMAIGMGSKVALWRRLA